MSDMTPKVMSNILLRKERHISSDAEEKSFSLISAGVLSLESIQYKSSIVIIGYTGGKIIYFDLGNEAIQVRYSFRVCESPLRKESSS